MWRESTQERANRYRSILARTPELLTDPTDSFEDLTEEDQVVTNVARYVVGPVLYAYVDWVIRSAIEAGQKRLYFLARDGYLMYHAAKIYCEVKHIDIDCRYLYCSRYALRIPMYHLNRADAMEYICRNGMHITPERILRRSGMEQELCRQLAAEYFPQWKPNQELSRQELAQLTESLRANDAFWELCAAHSRKAYPEAETYLVQEGLLDGVPYALVDSGWIGSMQKTLGQLLKQVQATHPGEPGSQVCLSEVETVKAYTDGVALHDKQDVRLYGYYWGLYDLPEDTSINDYQAFFFSPSAGEREKCAFNNNLFEVLFSAPHGMTIGYQDGKPVFGKTQEEQVALIKKMEPILLDYVRTVATIYEQANRERHRAVIKELFACLMCQPTKMEAKVFGQIPFSDDIFAEAGRRLAEPETEDALNSSHPMQKMLRASGLKKEKEIVLPWYEGSTVLSAGNTEKHLKAYQKYKKLLTQKQERNWRNKT